MERKKYTSNQGKECEFITYATDTETRQKLIVYREFGSGDIFVCSESWWNDQGFLSTDEYGRTGINKYSPSEDKINLFMSLFVGRNDVYAKRWESKSGKSGYSPVCLNEWNSSVCLKPSGKCADCQHKNYAVFDSTTAEKHLLGKITAGIYPLITDETCRFLAVDFDDNDWQEDISAVFNLCKSKSIPAYMERSRSGNGGHLWIFFCENIPAALARKLGSCLLTSAMNERHEIKFSSYDRLFPNQDTMPKGGFGNLIALPLQKMPRKNGNSMFVDENFIPYEDQWAFLSSVRSLSENEVNKFIKTLDHNETGDLFNENSEKSEKPWETKKQLNLQDTDFPSRINIVLANMIFIEKSGISSKGMTYLKRLASFKNPDFYKSQAMRLSTYNKPRIISLAEESEQYVALPRGLFDDILQLFTENNITVNIEDKTNPGNGIDVEFSGELRPEQIEAKNALITKNYGVLSASTAFGKTVVGVSLIAERKVNTLILVHRTNLLKQWIDRLNDFLIINESPPIKYTPKGRLKKTSVIGQIGGTKDNPSGIIDVAVMQSLISNGEVKDIVREYGMIIADECHHVSAFTFKQILKNANAKYVYGLTATPTRQDGHHPIIYMQCGPITFRAENKLNPFAQYMIPRFTSFKNSFERITDLYNAIGENKIRNEMIVKDCVQAVDNGKTPIILTERTSHVDVLADMLKKYHVVKLVGGMGSKRNTEILNELSIIPKDDKLIIIATGKYVGEGFDFPRLDTLLLAMPISWKGTLQQYAGRLHREYDGKAEVQIYDYIDINVPMLEKMYQKRLKGYKSIGYKIRSDNTDNISSIYDSTDFFDVFAPDITEAKQEIIISSPYVSKRTVDKMLKLFISVIDKVIVVTRPPENYESESNRFRVKQCIDILRSCGMRVRLVSNLHQKFAVVDKSLVWYGSINFFSFGTSDENVMRLINTHIAEELIDSISSE